MPEPALSAIRGIVFDLDGTLYVSDPFAATIQEVATGYIASLKGVSGDEACSLMAATRSRLCETHGITPTLSTVCTELGGNIRELHAVFESRLRPESYLVRDERVIILLERLSQRFELSLFTNNNRALTTRIIGYLGLDVFFRHIFAIDDQWLAKPDESMLEQVLTRLGLTPAEALFVGDRYDVDLRLPEQRGCPVYLSQSVEQLLRLEELLN
ncbi:HAD family hydrolase [Geobacter sp. AOG2]|uniref:HAD family hydrolase n=1 Tax=Geobacter sp. AOG2 TaxID=1566347 RepID=UPI001CC4493E|nr:HAD family hydrolase [Geobacter sp. AOG2]GFE62207.1 haloacid dehalogenase [Geobacter sp. AOG2]